MDGGRVLRALLAMCVSHALATRIAAAIGQGLAICLALVGLFGNWNLLFVAAFVFIAARSEVEAVVSSRATGAQPVRTAEDSPYLFLPAEARAEEVARVLFTQQFYFPVMQGGTVIGILSRPMLLWALTHGRKDRLVAELMSVRGEPSAVKYQK